ncbi:hypothetical protein HYX16_04095 [Candidatus Woesearchaeota archaeon]|nr:hypothetical protein [Candidatus Woesearchaeota archaeon]
MNYDEIAARIVGKCLKECKSLEEFFESEEFNSLIRIIQEHEIIDQEKLRYDFEKIEGLTAENFGKVLESVFHNLSPEVSEEKKTNFPKYYVDYQGIRFHLMLGQGSAYWTTKIS